MRPILGSAPMDARRSPAEMTESVSTIGTPRNDPSGSPRSRSGPSGVELTVDHRLETTIDVHPSPLLEILTKRLGSLPKDRDSDPLGLVLPLAFRCPHTEV